MSFAKVFASMIHSTIWREADHVRIVWITMLILADRDGVVAASIPGLADVSRVSIDQCREALHRLSSPDEYSTSPEHEGRRIEPVRGGWRLLNYLEYRKKCSPEEARLKAAERKRRQREREADSDTEHSSRSVTVGHALSRDVTPATQSHDIAEAEAEAEAETRTKKACPRTSMQFANFWAAFPRRAAKKEALGVWKSKGLDRFADAIIEDVNRRKAEHRDWLEGFVPHAATYLRGERWFDEIDRSPPRSSTSSSSNDRSAPRLKELT